MKPLKIKTAQSSKKLENEIVKFSEFINHTIHKSFNNQVINKLNKGTINKFADAQTGNFGAVITKLVKDYQRKINKRFTQKRIKSFVKSIYEKTNKYNKDIMYSNVKTKMNIDLNDIVKTEKLQQFINAKTLETASYYEKFITERTKNLGATTLRLASAGKSVEDMTNTLNEYAQAGDNRARLIARNEIKTFNAQLTKKRATVLGVKKAIWLSSLDERTRECHEARHGEEFDLSQGCYSSCDGMYLQPSEEINCRCTYEMVVSYEDLLGLSTEEVEAEE